MIVALFLMIAIPGTSIAKTTFFNVTPEGTVSILPDSEILERLKTVNDFANLYFSNCAAATKKNTGMSEYLTPLCACAAATMGAAIDMEQAKSLFGLPSTGNAGDAFNRFMMLSYLPCVAQTVRDVSFDQCAASAPQINLSAPRETCTCIASGMEAYINRNGHVLLPGYTTSGFDIKESNNNPLPVIFDAPVYDQQSQSVTETCYQKRELNWAQ